MYVAIHCPRVHHAVCACAYRNSVKIINVHIMFTLIVAHQGGWTGNGRIRLDLVCINHLILYICRVSFRIFVKGGQFQPLRLHLRQNSQDWEEACE